MERLTGANGTAEVLVVSSYWFPFSFRAKVAESPPALAVMVAVCVVNPVTSLVENPTVVAPAGTSTDPGTVASLLELFRATFSPPEPAAAVSVTVQGSDPVPRYDQYLQDTLFTAGAECAMPVTLPSVRNNSVFRDHRGFEFLKQAVRKEKMDGR